MRCLPHLRFVLVVDAQSCDLTVLLRLNNFFFTFDFAFFSLVSMYCICLHVFYDA